MPHVPKTRVLPQMPTVPKVLLAILAGSSIALVVAQALSMMLHG